MDKPDLWSSMAFVRNVAHAAVRKGANLQQFCQAIGVAPDMLEQADAVADLDVCARVWDESIRLTGDPLLGLHLGETSSPALAGMVGYLMESSPDLLTAFQYVQQFSRAVTNATDFIVETRGDEFYYHIEPVPAWYHRYPEAARQIVDHAMSAFIHITRMLCGKAQYPQRVSMRCARPRDTREYVRIFKLEPQFGQSGNYLAYRLRDMQAPLLGHNPALNRLFKSLLEEQIAKTRGQESYANEVRRVMLQNFNTTLPQLPDVVMYLHTSPRTLQRKLQEEGTSFLAIAESVKSELAIGLLKKRTLTISEIAYKLGYAEPSVFIRAFKKWTGTSPGAYAVD